MQGSDTEQTKSAETKYYNKKQQDSRGSRLGNKRKGANKRKGQKSKTAWILQPPKIKILILKKNRSHRQNQKSSYVKHSTTKMDIFISIDIFTG